MTAKTYLKQIRVLYAKIEARLMDGYRLRCLVTKASSPHISDDVRVQTTRAYDPMGDMIAKIVDIENELNDLIDSYFDKKEVIIRQIEDMPEVDHIKVLSLRYIGNKTIDEVADEMGYTKRHTQRLHARALEQFERRYRDAIK